MSLRDNFSAGMKEAMKGGDKARLSVIRMIQAALKDRDIAARGTEHDGLIPDADILSMLQKMIKQGQESAETAQKAGRAELVAQSLAEIDVISSFLPAQMSEDEVRAAVSAAVAETGAAGVKDMGKVMAALKDRYAGQIDFGKAGAIVKSVLSA